jgi:hypothetical protein
MNIGQPRPNAEALAQICRDVRIAELVCNRGQQPHLS